LSLSPDAASPAQTAPRRFSGMDRLYGVEASAAIRSAHVMVVGIGGVGSWAAEALARSGVGRITLVDMDHVAESNINRQIHAEEKTLGQAKIEAMAQRIAGFHPDCKVSLVDDFVTPDNWAQIAACQPNAVIDACDQMSAKTAMAAWARQHQTLLVTCGAAGGKRKAQAIEVADLCEVTHDPLLSDLRYRLRKHHGAPKADKRGKAARIGVLCVFSKEAVAPPDESCQIDGATDSSLNCHGYGSLVTVTASFGLCAAGVVMNELAKRGGRAA
jgi:tRNA threonylcarbamoyladenosine dehydratase